MGLLRGLVVSVWLLVPVKGMVMPSRWLVWLIPGPVPHLLDGGPLKQVHFWLLKPFGFLDMLNL